MRARRASSSSSSLLGLAGCGTEVKDSDAFVLRGAHDARAAPREPGNAREGRRRDGELAARDQEAAYGKPIVTTLSAPTGPMIVPGSRVTLRIEAIDMGHGIAMEPATIAMFVPTPTPPGRRPPSHGATNAEDVQRARGMNLTDANLGAPAVPYVVRQDLPAFLEDRLFYTMGVGGVYEVPEVHHPIHGDHATIPRPPHAPTGDLRIASGRPKLKVTVLSACKADVRRVEIRYLEWDSGVDSDAQGLAPRPLERVPRLQAVGRRPVVRDATPRPRRSARWPPRPRRSTPRSSPACSGRRCC